MREIRRASFVALLVAGISIFVTACGGSSGSSSPLADAKKAGVMRVGFANEPPYSFVGPSGDLSGAGPGLSAAILKRLGVKAQEGVLTQYASLLPALQTNRFAVAVTMGFITPERCKQVIYSDPVMANLTSLAVKKGNPLGLKDFKDIAKTGARMALVAGGAELDEAKADGVKDSQISTYQDQDSAFQALRSGRADTYAATTAALRYMISTLGVTNLEVTPGFVPPGDVGISAFAFSKKDTALRDAFNKELKVMLRDGQAAKAMAPYFGQEDVNVAQKTTTAAQCAG
jgi:polar amino acid transport system substrate-binding protein